MLKIEAIVFNKKDWMKKQDEITEFFEKHPSLSLQDLVISNYTARNGELVFLFIYELSDEEKKVMLEKQKVSLLKKKQKEVEKQKEEKVKIDAQLKQLREAKKLVEAKAKKLAIEVKEEEKLEAKT